MGMNFSCGLGGAQFLLCPVETDRPMSALLSYLRQGRRLARPVNLCGRRGGQRGMRFSSKRLDDFYFRRLVTLGGFALCIMRMTGAGESSIGNLLLKWLGFEEWAR